MVSCAACGCSQTAKNKDKGITFHHFPKNPEKRSFWIKIVNRMDWTPTKTSVLCSQHFTDDCFDRTSSLKVRLKDIAVPTIEVKRLKYVRTFNEELKINVAEIPSTSREGTTPSEYTSPSTPPRQPLHEIIHDENYTSQILPHDTPRKARLKRKLQDLYEVDKLKSMKIRRLQRVAWRQKRKISSLSDVIHELKSKNLINEDHSNAVINSFQGNKDIIDRLFKKSTNRKVKQKYSQNIRSFAVTLHFFSSKAYAYVRQKFSNCLPHPKTLAKWYASIEAQPGFTTEAFQFLQLNKEHSEKNLVCSLVFDEIAIRQHIQFDGNRYLGYVDFGNRVDNESMDVAKEALVFMLVAINESWKLPLGYFFIKHITSEQKCSLVKQCLFYLNDCGVTVSNITFDGCPTNLSMCKLFGCNFDTNNLITNFAIDDTWYYVLPDPSHMIKLVRNAFGEKIYFIDIDGNKIDFNFVIKLNELQENEGLHLSNKLRRLHIHFFKQKMKVKLATQLLSRSVADALLFCKDMLKLEDFKDCGATANFIMLMNDAFDILNSRKLKAFGYKRALCENNFTDVTSFMERFHKYVTNLKLLDGTFVLQSNRKTGFLGLLVSLNSLKGMYNEYVSNKKILKFIPVYKCNQDHIELFFGSIRSHGGHNNNPTCRQFTAAYKKILIHAEIREGGVGNCVPLEQVNILNVASKNKSAEQILNETNIFDSTSSEIDNCDNDVNYLEDHDYAFSMGLSNFSTEICIYIAGFVVYKLAKMLNCEHCLSQLYGEKCNFLHSFLEHKNKGGLSYPSDDVINICSQAEIYLREEKTKNNFRISKDAISYKIMKYFRHKEIFKNMPEHDSHPLESHRVLLIKSVSNVYATVRIHFICKNMLNVDRIRHMYNKFIIFKGQ